MAYQCPKGHQSTDADYCSECGALIGKPKIVKAEPMQSAQIDKPVSSGVTGEICPDCGTERAGDARFCEVCRHDFQENKTGVAEAIVASQQSTNTNNITDKAKDNVAAPTDGVVNKASDNYAQGKEADKNINDISSIKKQDQSINNAAGNSSQNSGTVTLDTKEAENYGILQKLNVIISVDKDKVTSWDGNSPIKADMVDRVFPLDLDENLVGRRSVSKGIYPEIEINDPGVSHRHLKFIKQASGDFEALELGSSNGTELNGNLLEPGVNALVKSGDELTLGIWTRLKIVAR